MSLLLSLAGGSGVTGSVSWTEANDTASLVGAVTVSGAASWTEANDVLAANGSVGAGVTGSIAWVEDDDQWALAGAVGAAPTTGGGGAWIFKNNQDPQAEKELIMLLEAFLEVM